jgi:DNA-binding CsgD family transcriptional regulator
MARSDAAAARAWIAELGADLPVLPLHPMDVTDEPHLVRLALACGDRDLGAAAVATAEHRARLSSQVVTVEAAAAHARGLLDDDIGRLAHAAGRLHHSERPLALASALEDLGAAHLRRGSRDAALEVLDQALLLYTGAGASWDARRVRGRLRASGVRRRLLPEARPARGWAALTESEAAVARLVADGLTNREAAERLFVSPHTVNSHLRHAFTKLGISSRVELARIAAASSAGTTAEVSRPATRP